MVLYTTTLARLHSFLVPLNELFLMALNRTNISSIPSGVHDSVIESLTLINDPFVMPPGLDTYLCRSSVRSQRSQQHGSPASHQTSDPAQRRIWDDRSLHASLSVDRPTAALPTMNIQPLRTVQSSKPWACVRLITSDQAIGPR
jgi:hypothetical protein